MEEFYYMTAIDAGRTAILLGAFESKEDCEKYAYGEYRKKIVDEACKIDPKAHFYAYGMIKTTDNSLIGCLNYMLDKVKVTLVTLTTFFIRF